jgi:hypothetical protein
LINNLSYLLSASQTSEQKRQRWIFLPFSLSKSVSLYFSSIFSEQKRHHWIFPFFAVSFRATLVVVTAVSVSRALFLREG